MTRRIVAAAVAVVLALVAGVAVLLYVRTADARALAGQQAVKAVHRRRQHRRTHLRQALDDGLLRPELVALEGVPAGALQDRGIDGGLRARSATSRRERSSYDRFGDEVACRRSAGGPRGQARRDG